MGLRCIARMPWLDHRTNVLRTQGPDAPVEPIDHMADEYDVAIRACLSDGHAAIRALAEAYGVSCRKSCHIKDGTTWRHMRATARGGNKGTHSGNDRRRKMRDDGSVRALVR